MDDPILWRRLRGSNPGPGCFAVQGCDGERPLTCDADSPTLPARARRGPAVPDAARTQHGAARPHPSGRRLSRQARGSQRARPPGGPIERIGKLLLLPGGEAATEAQAEGEAEARGIGADADDRNGGLVGAGDEQLHRHHAGQHVGGWPPPRPLPVRPRPGRAMVAAVAARRSSLPDGSSVRSAGERDSERPVWLLIAGSEG
jgi:hypothetical protein